MFLTIPSANTRKAVLVLGHAAIVLTVFWLFLGRGWTALGLNSAATPERVAFVLGCASIYWLRLLVTTFVFLRRTVPWQEVAIVLPWMAILHFGFAFGASRTGEPAGFFMIVGLLLYVAGSWLNTTSELGRHRWKKTHPGRLYTGGLFRYSRHINYFGDTVLFTGYALVSGPWWVLTLPALMTAGFIFEHVPRLDKHLATKYKEEYQQWANRTAQFVPFLY